MPTTPPPTGQNPWAPPTEGSQAPDPTAGPTSGTMGPPMGPPPGYGSPFPSGMPPQIPAPRNGMGISALVLGIVGALFGVVFFFLFWLTWLPALLAVIFGFVALGQVKKGVANNKGVALTGLVLGVVGLLIAIGAGIFTVLLVKDVTDKAQDRILEIDRSADKEADAQAKEAAEEEAAEKARSSLKFGQTYTTANGLKVTVSKPAPFSPDDFANGHTKGNKAIEVSVKVVNSGGKKVDLQPGLPRVFDADGADAELVIDGSGRQIVMHGMLLPGRDMKGRYAYSLPPQAATEAKVQFSLGEENPEELTWSGPLK
ncbi:DUF4190 domain-containing protein [Streptomyces sp. NPDC051561]|uniref:DUF4190 domain-containing protein n=1 Tax=Streptomyces sp. NPDC051561 TaxID=3365658 RepID=UPI0037B3D35A